MSLISTFGRTAEKGYTQARMAVGDSPTQSSESAQFMPDANVGSGQTVGAKTAGAAVDAANSVASGGSKTAMTQLTGIDHANHKSLKTNVQNVTSGANAGQNAQASVTAQSVKADLGEAKGNFVKAVEQTQAVLTEALTQGADNLGFDQKEVGASFAPATQRSELGVLAGVAGGAAVATASAIGDIRSALAKKLSPQDEARLAQQVQKLLTPVRDTQGNVIGPAPIPNNLDQEALEKVKPAELVQLIKEVMKPPEMHPEMKAFDSMGAKLDTELAIHNDKRDVDQIAVASNVDTADFDVNDLDDDALDRISAYGIELNEFPHAGLVAQNDSIFDLNLDNDAISAAINDAKKSPVSEYEITVPQQVAALGAAA
jgi:hypothetical protein